MTHMSKPKKTILTLFGTRPEVIKLAPVIKELESASDNFRSVNVTSAQHTDLLYPFISLFDLRIDYDLRIMEPNQTPNQVCSRVLSLLDPILVKEQPDCILVQGDTTTAMAGALAGFHRRIPVGHVEAGLRSGNPYSPYPEEMNRRVISRVAAYHFAATPQNREALLLEGIHENATFLTGNPVVDSLKAVLARPSLSPTMQALLDSTDGLKRIILTTHRRESFGEVMGGNLKVLRNFVVQHDDIALVFPVHPNPSVSRISSEILSGHPRIQLIPPLTYEDFIRLLANAWLIVSDSGGVQEEAPTLRKPLLILRENTERPEAVNCGVAKLVGGRPERLAAMLEQVYGDGLWFEEVSKIENPFGKGDSGRRIVEILERVLDAPRNTSRAA